MQKIYCTNTSCAKPIPYQYEKPSFCPHCGNKLGFNFAKAGVSFNPTPKRTGFAPPAAQPTWAEANKRANKIVNRLDDDEDDDGDELYSEQEHFDVDFDNFSLKASVQKPKDMKLTLGDLMKMKKDGSE
jgi:hypothetical protein